MIYVHYLSVLLYYNINLYSIAFQAAAALCVGIGSFSDPDDIPGLAHFLEHSLYFF